jgi:uncharacterized membrane protein YqjE
VTDGPKPDVPPTGPRPADATTPSTPPATPPPAASNGDTPPEEMTVGQLVFEVSDRATVLVREEIELAKTEVTEKLNSLLRGGVTALVAGVFVLAALVMIMHAFALGLNDLFFETNPWAGYLVEAGLFLLLAAAGGFYAYRSFKKSSPPVPEMAIEQAQEIKATFDNDEDEEKKT